MQHQKQRLQDHLIIPQTLPIVAFSSSSSSTPSASASKYSEINFNPTSMKNCTAQLEILIKKWKAIVKMQQENEHINNQNKNNNDDEDQNEQIKVAFAQNLSLFADTLFPRALTSLKQGLDSISLYHQQLVINGQSSQSSVVLNDEKKNNSLKPSNENNNNKEDDDDDEHEKINDGRNEEKVNQETSSPSSSSVIMLSKMKSAFLNIATIFNEQAFFLKTSFSLLGQMIEYFTTRCQHHQHNNNNNLHHHLFLIQTKVTRIISQLLQFVLLFSSFERNNNFRNTPIISTLFPSFSSSSSSTSGLNSILQIVVLEVKKLLQGVHFVSQSMLLMIFDEDNSASLMSLFSLTRTTTKNENENKNNTDETFNGVSFKRTELEATLQMWFDQMFDYIFQIIQAENDEYKNSIIDDDDDVPFYSKNLHLILDILSKITSLSRKNDELHHYVATRHHQTTDSNNNYRNMMMVIDINSIIKDNVAPLYNLCNSAEVIAMIASEGNDARTRQLLDFNRRCEEIMNLNLSSRMKEEEFKRKILNEALMMKKEDHQHCHHHEKEKEDQDEHSPSPILFTQQEVEELLEKQSQYNANEIKILKSVAQDLRKRNSAVKKQQE